MPIPLNGKNGQCQVNCMSGILEFGYCLSLTKTSELILKTPLRHNIIVEDNVHAMHLNALYILNVPIEAHKLGCSKAILTKETH